VPGPFAITSELDRRYRCVLLSVDVLLGELMLLSLDIDDVSPLDGAIVLSVVTPVLGLVVGLVLVVSYPPELGAVVLVVS
jgi:hypothetical protein